MILIQPLRKRIPPRLLRITLIGGALAAWVLLLYGSTAGLLQQNYEHLEEKQTRQNVDQVMASVRRELNAVSTATLDLKPPSDEGATSPRKALGLNRRAAVADPGPDGLDLVAWVRPDGRIDFLRGRGREGGAMPALPAYLRPYLARESPLLLTDGAATANGVACLPNGEMILASRRVSGEGGDGRGWLVAGRWIGPKVIDGWSKQAGNLVDLWRCDLPYLPPDVQDALESLQGEKLQGGQAQNTFVRALDGQNIAGYSLLTDLLGRSGVVVRTTVFREFSRQGGLTIRLYMALLFGSAVVFGVFILVLVERAFRSQTAHREIRRRYTAFTETSTEGMILFEPGTLNVVEANAAAARLLGMPPAEIAGSRLDVLLSCPEESLQRSVEGVRAGGTAYMGEFTLREGKADAVHLDAMGHRDGPEDGDRVSLILRDVTSQKRSERALRASEERYALAAKGANDGLWDWDLAAGTVYYSPRWKSMIGLEEGEGVKDLDDWLRRIHPNDLPLVQFGLARHLDGHSPCFECEYRLLHRDGDYRWVRTRGECLRDAGGKAVRISGSQTDITERKRGEEGLRQSEERFRALVRNASDVIAILDEDGTLGYVSPSSIKTWGYTPDELKGKNGFRLVRPQDLVKMQSLVQRVLADPQGSAASEVQFLHANGTTRACEVILSNQTAEPGVGGVVLTCRDITERKQFEERLSHQAFHDPLSGLPNRSLFIDRVERALTRVSRTMNPIAVMFLDLDGFKTINDSLGHDAGDQLLVTVAQRLQVAVRAGDTVARLGGDEFTILLEDLISLEDADEVAQRMTESLNRPVHIQGRDIFITASMGIAYSGLESRSADDLLRDADAAMYWAKGNGKARYKKFDKGMSVQALERLELQSDMRRALERKEFRIYYQPIMDLETNRLLEVEALVRWEHPEKGLIPPGRFIPLAEETGMIVPLGGWILEEACRQAQAWQAGSEEAAGLTVSVNLSGRQLHQPQIVEQVADVLERTGLSPHKLKLEITESVMLQDLEATVEKLHRLKALGIRLAIDDFGTGYSSLSYLSNLPIDTIKIDQSFIQKIGTFADDDAIVMTMLALAKSLKLDVTSEGIETNEQRAFLKGLGCERGQGFYFDEPLSGEALDERFASAAPTPA